MDLTPYLTSLREDLTTTASAGDEDTRRAAALLAAAIEPAARLAIMHALSDLAAEVTSQLDGPVVDVRLDGRDVQVAVTHAKPEQDGPPPPPPPPPPGSESGENISRMTLRMFEELKAKAESEAAAQGVSMNTFVTQALQNALHSKQAKWQNKWGGKWGEPGQDWSQHKGGGGSRVRGWTEA